MQLISKEKPVETLWLRLIGHAKKEANLFMELYMETNSGETAGLCS